MGMKCCLTVTVICICLIMVMSRIMSYAYWLVFSSSAYCPFPLPILPLGHSSFFLMIYSSPLYILSSAHLPVYDLLKSSPSLCQSWTLRPWSNRIFNFECSQISTVPFRGCAFWVFLKKSVTALKVKIYFSYIFF